MLRREGRTIVKELRFSQSLDVVTSATRAMKLESIRPYTLPRRIRCVADWTLFGCTHSINFWGQGSCASSWMEAAVFLFAKGAITSAAKHQFRTIIRIAAMEAKVMAKTEKTL